MLVFISFDPTSNHTYQDDDIAVCWHGSNPAQPEDIALCVGIETCIAGKCRLNDII